MRRALSRAGCCDKASPRLSDHSGEPEGESGPALEPMHYFTLQVTAQHTGTNANRRRGVSKRCVLMCVCICSFMPPLQRNTRSIQYASQPNNLDQGWTGFSEVVRRNLLKPRLVKKKRRVCYKTSQVSKRSLTKCKKLKTQGRMEALRQKFPVFDHH